MSAHQIRHTTPDRQVARTKVLRTSRGQLQTIPWYIASWGAGITPTIVCLGMESVNLQWSTVWVLYQHRLLVLHFCFAQQLKITGSLVLMSSGPPGFAGSSPLLLYTLLSPTPRPSHPRVCQSCSTNAYVSTASDICWGKKLWVWGYPLLFLSLFLENRERNWLKYLNLIQTGINKVGL